LRIENSERPEMLIIRHEAASLLSAIFRQLAIANCRDTLGE
jgi:hypothetical protein